MTKRAKLCPGCGMRHHGNFELCEIAKQAETFGARVAWARDPDEFEHQISFTPSMLSAFIEDQQS